MRFSALFPLLAAVPVVALPGVAAATPPRDCFDTAVRTLAIDCWTVEIAVSNSAP